MNLTSKVSLLSEKYGFRTERVNSFENADAIHLKFSELESFLKYQKQSKTGISEIDFSEISKVFENNNIPITPLSVVENESESSINSTSNERILCMQNAHLVTARVPAMVLPGSDLNGVDISIGVGNGNLNACTFGMYGFYPFMGVTGGIVNPDNITSWSSNNQYAFQIQYTVSFNLFIDGTSFVNYETYYLKVMIDACTGHVSWNHAIP